MPSGFRCVGSFSGTFKSFPQLAAGHFFDFGIAHNWFLQSHVITTGTSLSLKFLVISFGATASGASAWAWAALGDFGIQALYFFVFLLLLVPSRY